MIVVIRQYVCMLFAIRYWRQTASIKAATTFLHQSFFYLPVVDERRIKPGQWLGCVVLNCVSFSALTLAVG